LARVCVTGGNGFLGSRIVRALQEHGYEVVALVGADLDSGNLEGVDVERRDLDLLDPGSVHKALDGGELLVHNAACYSFWEPDAQYIYRVNVRGTRHVLDAARDHGYRRIVYTSSTATLTPSLDRELESEEGLLDLRRFHGHYKCSKMLAEIAVLREMARGLPGMIVHPTAVIGPGDRRPTPSGGIVLHFINGRMKVYADTALNLVDVDDVARGHVLALERGELGERYILGGENSGLGEVAGLLSELTGIAAPRVAIPAGLLGVAGRVGEWLADHVTHRTPLVDRESTLHALRNRPVDSSKAVRELGYNWRPMRVTLARAVEWFVENGYCKPRFARRIREHGVLEGVASASPAEAWGPGRV